MTYDNRVKAAASSVEREARLEKRRIEADQAMKDHMAAEAAFRSLFEASPTPITLMVNRRLIRVNPKLCQSTGYSEAAGADVSWTNRAGSIGTFNCTLL